MDCVHWLRSEKEAKYDRHTLPFPSSIHVMFHLPCLPYLPRSSLRTNVWRISFVRRSSRRRRRRKSATFWRRGRENWNQWCRTWRPAWRSRRSSTRCCRLRRTSFTMPSRGSRNSECSLESVKIVECLIR